MFFKYITFSKPNFKHLFLDILFLHFHLSYCILMRTHDFNPSEQCFVTFIFSLCGGNRLLKNCMSLCNVYKMRCAVR